MLYRQTTYRSLTGSRSLIELSDFAYGEWIVYENNVPKYHVQCFDEKESSSVIKALLTNGKTFENILDCINKQNGTRLSLKKRPIILIVKRTELIELDLKPLPNHLLKELK
ncbi:hypothetical protein C8P68_104265 [Mucilaginibacter yixingensis]|uniref:Uncharacterized protein n=1 Tax=Mucilaginibacter yixingensis TaxID=1295612 RepID=A0A2T5J9P0_9SPHI|nr:hypothetical protein C8P68_104265 [Mucilaginibacter yixingensis]